MINIFYKLIDIIKNTINCFMNSNSIFPLFIILIIFYIILNYIFEIIEKEFLFHSNNVETITITIPNTFIFKNVIIFMLILLSNLFYKYFIKN